MYPYDYPYIYIYIYVSLETIYPYVARRDRPQRDEAPALGPPRGPARGLALQASGPRGQDYTIYLRNLLGWLETRLAQNMSNYIKIAYMGESDPTEASR